MSYFAGLDRVVQVLIPDGEKCTARITYLVEKATNNKKRLDVKFTMVGGDYDNRDIYSTYWWDEERKKYDPRKLYVLIRKVCESNDLNTDEIIENIETTDDIISFLKNKIVGVEISQNIYQSFDGDTRSTNKIKKVFDNHILVDSEKLLEEKTSNVVAKEKVAEKETYLDIEEDDLPF